MQYYTHVPIASQTTGGRAVPAKPRSEVFDPEEVGVYHCWNRLVRRRHLFGFDTLTGIDYSYRKNWLRDRLKELAGSMAVEVLDYAILDNHLHVVLRNRPDIVGSWSDEEVARRWWYVCPARRNEDGSIPDPKPCEIGLYLQQADEFRKRLSDISWMMRLACQPIARRANREDDVDGRFFAKRFDCERLETWEDVLACSIYVDLNWIRAGMADTPEESFYTSACDRIRARWQRAGRELGTSAGLPTESEEADAWLAPIFLDERADAYGEQLQTGADGPEAGPRHNPPRSSRISNKGFLPTTLDQYLTLLDTLGRMLRQGKRGAIPANAAPLLERLNVETSNWLQSLWSLLHNDRLAARRHAVAGHG